MSLGYGTLLKYKRAEELANSLGFIFVYAKYRNGDEDLIGLQPKDDMLPIYARDAQLFVGDLHQVISFLQGIEFHFNYLRMLKITTKEKIEIKEDHVRQQHLIDVIKGEKSNKVQT